MFAFAKTPDDNLASLAKEIDKVVAANADKKLAAVLHFTGELTDEYQEKVAKFVEDNDLKNVAVVTTAEADRFKVSDDAAFTVMHYKDKQVKFNYSTKTTPDQQAAKAVIAGVDSVLN